VVWVRIEKWTINETIATTDKKNGIPKDGFTTSHILPWFMNVSSVQPG
jgi:hypothetical protein